MKKLLLLLALSNCAYQNPNVNTYNWHPSFAPDPESRSFLGFDPAYEQHLINAYVSSHRQQVSIFRAENDVWP